MDCDGRMFNTRRARPTCLSSLHALFRREKDVPLTEAKKAKYLLKTRVMPTSAPVRSWLRAASTRRSREIEPAEQERDLHI